LAFQRSSSLGPSLRIDSRNEQRNSVENLK